MFRNHLLRVALTLSYIIPSSTAEPTRPTLEPATRAQGRTGALEATWDRFTTDKGSAIRLAHAVVDPVRFGIRLAPTSACLNFGPPPTVGTKYGRPGQHPGDVVLDQNGIAVRVERFQNPGLPFAFDSANIAAPGHPAGFGIGQRLGIHSINLQFSFAEVGFRVHRVSFEYAHQGGIENLSVNGSPIFAGTLSAAPTIVGGSTVQIGPTAPIPGGRKGKILIVGKVKEFEVGGQEFWLDNVCAST